MWIIFHLSHLLNWHWFLFDFTCLHDALLVQVDRRMKGGPHVLPGIICDAKGTDHEVVEYQRGPLLSTASFHLCTQKRRFIYIYMYMLLDLSASTLIGIIKLSYKVPATLAQCVWPATFQIRSLNFLFTWYFFSGIFFFFF
jgi:hypothetical protein